MSLKMYVIFDKWVLFISQIMERLRKDDICMKKKSRQEKAFDLKVETDRK